MSEALSPAEVALLRQACARIDSKGALAAHHRAVAQGARPAVSLTTWRRDCEAARLGQALAGEALGRALAKDASPEARLADAAVAVAALPRQLEAIAAQATAASAGAVRRGRARFRRALSRSVGETARLVCAALEARQTGLQVAPSALRTAQAYVQEEDLEDVIPDGWGRTLPLEASRLGRRAGVAPLAVPLLCLLTWASQAKAAAPRDVHRCGAGFQVSLEWLARKLGCTTSWVKSLLNRLDVFAAWRREVAAVRRENARRRRLGGELLAEPRKPQGTPWAHRFRRLVPYANVAGAAGAVWLDASGRPRFNCDVRGVCYVTDMGRALLVRRQALRDVPRPGHRPALRRNAYLADVQRRARPVAWRVRLRLGLRVVDFPVDSEKAAKRLPAPAD